MKMVKLVYDIDSTKNFKKVFHLLLSKLNPKSENTNLIKITCRSAEDVKSVQEFFEKYYNLKPYKVLID